jgi:hypothetical protein
MNDKLLTQHAISRCQQRGINSVMIDLILSFGDEEHLGEGVKRIHIHSRNLKKATKALGKALRKADKLGGMYLIESPDGRVITAAHIQH